MRRIVSALSVLVAGLGILLVPATPAHAIGGAWLGCAISPSNYHTPLSPACVANKTASQYTVSFRVTGGSGVYGYAWQTAGRFVVGGCTSTSDVCQIRTNPGVEDSLSVVITQDGQSATLTARYYINHVCGTMWC